MRQRGLRSEDIHFVCQHGTETAKGYLLTDKDAAALEAEAHQLLRKAQKLRGILVPVADGNVKTAFRATSLQQSCLL
jgi:hypothetical protein